MLMSGVPDGTVMSNNIHTFRSLNMRDRICWTNFFRCSLLGMRWMISNNNFLSCWKIKIFNIIMKFYIACRIYTMITAQDEVTRVQKYSTFTISTKFLIVYMYIKAKKLRIGQIFIIKMWKKNYPKYTQ